MPCAGDDNNNYYVRVYPTCRLAIKRDVTSVGRLNRRAYEMAPSRIINRGRGTVSERWHRSRRRAVNGSVHTLSGHVKGASYYCRVRSGQLSNQRNGGRRREIKNSKVLK